MKKAIFPGSFDPMHKGHLHILEKANKVFDEVLVVVANNEHKENQTPIDKRVEQVKSLVNNQVIKYEGEELVKWAFENGYTVSVRSIRNEDDLMWETELMEANKKLQPEVETIFFYADDEFKNISSSKIKKNR